MSDRVPEDAMLPRDSLVAHFTQSPKNNRGDVEICLLRTWLVLGYLQQP